MKRRNATVSKIHILFHCCILRNPAKPDRRLRRERPNEKITGVYMPNIGGIIKSLQNIMRKDQGVSGDAQRIEQLGWMVTLKILDDKEAENPAGVFGTV